MHRNLQSWAGCPVVLMTDSGQTLDSTRKRRAALRCTPCLAGTASVAASLRTVAALPRASRPASVAGMLRFGAAAPVVETGGQAVLTRPASGALGNARAPTQVGRAGRHP